jgi:hypothetical protein
MGLRDFRIIVDSFHEFIPRSSNNLLGDLMMRINLIALSFGTFIYNKGNVCRGLRLRVA